MDRNVCITWSGVASCGISVVLWIISRHETKKAKDLDKAKPVSSISDAINLSKCAPILIAIRGKTGSDEPIISEITSTAAVLAEITEELSALKQNEKGDWLPDTYLIRHQKWETDWFINDGTNTRLFIENALSADLLRGSMLITAQEYREGSRSVYSRILDRLTGYSPMGVRKTERVLPIDSMVTVVGELANPLASSPPTSLSSNLDNDESNLVIRKPQNSSGRPFYVTKQTLNELHSSLSKVASTCKWLAVGFGAVSMIIAGGQTIRHVTSKLRYRRIRRQLEQEERRRIINSINNSYNDSRTSSSSKHDEKITKCIICLDNMPDAVFIPCGHLCICLRCSLGLKKCPVCRCRGTIYRTFQ